CVNGFSGLDSW
nr:immunoglobulin heavy chain junction region [Macaca mulatta]MOV38056.1 immunoglobulin heavy chain junction region [Macaca mulatta]MOV38508.1 immunoglobulin heavy chain junction region [Macaca mulatta]MOV38585.1 immunoglobulin heavy chain junction region [Macaca mulatta]MOV39016.1 immunoglobulin heavy chain junction region [Macaca mulatta]